MVSTKMLVERIFMNLDTTIQQPIEPPFISQNKAQGNSMTDFFTGMTNSMIENQKKLAENNANMIKDINGIYYDPRSIDSIIDARNTATSWKRDDTALARFVQQAKAAGINPALILGAGSAEAFSTTGNSVKASQVESNNRKRTQNVTGALSACAALVGSISMLIGSLGKIAG